ncbi:CAP-Gly domain-containing linker protein 1 isoform X13, partial [Asbolus verrucosus]
MSLWFIITFWVVLDLLEADESEEDGLDCLRSSSRRKRYSSNSSAVLTEDTDSFIIGQRVWVGGTKPGTIAYIGETQFAPGEWAGIALDEPIVVLGKNDGSVAGTRYFQCENKKGVFSRLTRLTRVPLEQPGMGSSETFTSPNNGVRRSPISPTGSTKSLLKSPTLSTSNTSLTSSAHVDFKIGDRVIIKSTQGSKVGTVRYMGLTDFAPGEWVGVELDDPRGKNDGSVEGKRYFECRQHFGLFAPISKVSKSPSKHKPGACVVHSGGPGLPPSGLKR